MIMQQPTLNKSLLDDIRSGQDAKKIASSYKKSYPADFILESISNVEPFHRLMLCAATEHNHKELLELLLSDFGRYLNGNPRPLFVAIGTGNLAFVQILINAGSSINSIGCNGQTFALSAIEIACIYDQLEILQLLLGPTVKQRSNSREASLHYACKHGAFKCIHYLLTTDAGTAQINSFKYVDYLDVSNQCRAVNNISRAGVHSIKVLVRPERSTPMMLGCKHGSQIVVKLLESGASILFQTRHKRQTVLHVAVEAQANDLPDVIESLINAGIPVNERDWQNKTSLKILIEQIMNEADHSTKQLRTTVEAIRVLLSAGARIDDIDRYNLMKYLLQLVKIICTSGDWLRNSVVTDEIIENSFKPAVELVILLFLQRANLGMRIRETCSRKNGENETNFVLFMALNLIQNRNLHAREGDCLLVFEMMMSSLCDVLRCCLLAGSKLIVYHNMKQLVPRLVRCESEPSVHFLHLMLESLSDAQIHELANMFCSDMVTRSWMQNIDLPSSLKTLARRCIINAMSDRALCGVQLLGLPLILQEYILCLN